jgi:hypothetical protein
MSIWVWVPIGGVALMAVPIVVSLAVARILGGIAWDVSRALDQELWSSAPLRREMEQAADELFEWRVPRSFSASDM